MLGSGYIATMLCINSIVNWCQLVLTVPSQISYAINKCCTTSNTVVIKQWNLAISPHSLVPRILSLKPGNKANFS